MKKQGIDELLDSILLETEMLELKASSQQTSRGTVIEAQVEQGRGPTATIIVRTGTLNHGDAFICGNFDGKVKSADRRHRQAHEERRPFDSCESAGLLRPAQCGR